MIAAVHSIIRGRILRYAGPSVGRVVLSKVGKRKLPQAMIHTLTGSLPLCSCAMVLVFEKTKQTWRGTAALGRGARFASLKALPCFCAAPAIPQQSSDHRLVEPCWLMGKVFVAVPHSQRASGSDWSCEYKALTTTGRYKQDCGASRWCGEL